MADNWADGEFVDETPDLDLGSGYADGKSVDQVDQDSKNECPEGKYTFLIRKIDFDMEDDPATFTRSPKKGREPYYIGEREGFFDYIQLKVALEVEGDSSKSVLDFFRTPPTNSEEAEFYARGTVKPNGHRAGVGWHWREYKQFLGHLGFEAREDGTFPPEACNTRNWRFWPNGEPRRIVAIVERQAGKDKNGKSLPVRSSIKAFSYEKSDHTKKMMGLPVSDPEPAKSAKPAKAKNTTVDHPAPVAATPGVVLAESHEFEL